jgi:predicted nucleotidyltransferase
MTYFDMCDFREDLEVLLEKRIDLVPHKTLKAIIRDSVYRDLLVIYEK